MTARVLVTGGAGYIGSHTVKLLVEEGMIVEKGQVLARLDDSDAQRRYDATRADRNVARLGSWCGEDLATPRPSWARRLSDFARLGGEQIRKN